MTSISPLTAPAANFTDSVSMTILGTGAWGSALATLAGVSGHQVQIWSRRGQQSLADSVAGADIIVNAISMKGVPEMVQRLQEAKISKSAILVSATKGLDPETLRTPSQILQASFPDHPIAVLSGPNLSKEIEQGMPAATVVASENQAVAETVQKQFSSENFRVYTNSDRLGTELGGTLKNVIAIAVGVCDGLKLGDNARAALVTRALPELIRVGTHLGGQAETFFGLSGLGDLLATCTSPLSRNYQVGYQLAQGKSLEQILIDLNSTAEGVNTANVLIRLANQEQIPIPISRQVFRLLNGKITPQEAVEALMERDLKSENYDGLI